jgi:hypothetical protein
VPQSWSGQQKVLDPIRTHNLTAPSSSLQPVVTQTALHENGVNNYTQCVSATQRITVGQRQRGDSTFVQFIRPLSNACYIGFVLHGLTRTSPPHTTTFCSCGWFCTQASQVKEQMGFKQVTIFTFGCCILLRNYPTGSI